MPEAARVLVRGQALIVERGQARGLVRCWSVEEAAQLQQLAALAHGPLKLLGQPAGGLKLREQPVGVLKLREQPAGELELREETVGELTMRVRSDFPFG